MSDTGQADFGGGAKPPAKPQFLRTLVEAMGKWRHAPEPDVNLVLVSAASALPEAKRSENLVEQMGLGVSAIGAKRGGTCYQVSDCDFAILVAVTETGLVGLVRDLKVEMLRTIEKAFPGSFGTIDQSRLVLSYDLTNNYRSAADRLAKYAEIAQKSVEETEVNDKQLRALTTGDIKHVMKAYEKFGNEKFVKAFVRTQDVVLNITGKKPEKILTEYFISMDLLRKPLFVDVEMRGSGRLFNEFTLVLDQILLRAFNEMHKTDEKCSVNLNVESVFTEAFEDFIDRTPAEVLSKVVFEFRQSNIVENFDEFQVARGLINSKGAHIAVDQIFPQTVGLVDVDYIGATIAKIHWRTGAEEILKEREKAIKYMIDCNVLPVLIRVDNERALVVGERMGINMFQGFLIDDMFKEKSS